LLRDTDRKKGVALVEWGNARQKAKKQKIGKRGGGVKRKLWGGRNGDGEGRKRGGESEKEEGTESALEKRGADKEKPAWGHKRKGERVRHSFGKGSKGEKRIQQRQ